MKLAAALLGFSFLISKILGLLRDNLLASNFGAGSVTEESLFNLDTYYAAFRVPDLIFNLLSYGMLSAAFVPLFIEILKKENREGAFTFANEVLRVFAAAITGISIVLLIGAPYLTKLIAPGFSEEALRVTTEVTRLMLLTPLLFTIGSVAGSMGNALNRFAGLGLAPILYNIGIIGGIVFFVPAYGVYGVAWGVVAGAALHAVSQLAVVWRAGFRVALPRTLFWNARVKEMVVLSIPRIFGTSVTQLSLLIDTIIASTLAAGSITVMNFAINLESLPLGLIGISVAVVGFGTLSSYAVNKQMHEFVIELQVSLRRMLFLLIPSAIGMAVLRVGIVRLLLQWGKFDVHDATLTANVLGILLCGLIFGSSVFLLARAFYALKDTKTPVLISVIAVSFKIALSLIFTKLFPYDVYGLALATAAADIINALALLLILQKRLNARLIDVPEVGKSVAGALCMGIVVTIILQNGPNLLDPALSRIDLLSQVAMSIIAGILAYGGSCLLLRCKDLQKFRRYMW